MIDGRPEPCTEPPMQGVLANVYFTGDPHLPTTGQGWDEGIRTASDQLGIASPVAPAGEWEVIHPPINPRRPEVVREGEPSAPTPQRAVVAATADTSPAISI